MTDDLTLGANNATPPSGAVIASDDVGGRHHQSIKVQLGADGSARGYLDNNVVTTVLASAARTATTNSDEQTKLNGRGLMLILDVTAEAASETLSLKIQVLDPVGETDWVDLVDFGTVYDASSALPGAFVFVAYPGVSDADYVSAVIAKNVVIPLTWRAVITHSSTGSWTYSLAAVAIN